MEQKDDQQLPEEQYGPETPPPLPLPPRPLPAPRPRQPPRAPESTALSVFRLTIMLAALVGGLVAELSLGTVDVSNDGIGRMLQMVWIGPVLLTAWFSLLISAPVLLHWLLTRIETTLHSWIFWALLGAVAINTYVVYAHGGLWSQLRT